MATKPTPRIPLWASGGTTTDPGAGKEATGWVVDDRPPANWWNWLLNTIGQWLGWSEDSIDDLESDVANLLPARVNALGVLETGSTPSIEYNRAGISGITCTSTYAEVDLSVTYASADQMVIFVTCEQNRYVPAATAFDTNTIRIAFADVQSGGATEDVSLTTVKFHLCAMGSLA